MAEEKNIATGLIGNALRSSAADHTTTFTDEVFDTERQKHQSEVNIDIESKIEEEAQARSQNDQLLSQAIAAEQERAEAAEEANAQGIIYDVSARNDGVVFESISTLLSSSDLSTLIPTSVRHGGMSIRFVQSSDNKYVQYRLMSYTFNTTVANWQGVDDEPTVGSDNLVKSGGVAIALDTFSDIHKELTAETSNLITISDDNDEEVVIITPDGVDAKNLKSNGKDVLIYDNAPTDNDSQELLLCSDDGNDEYVKLGKYGIKSIAYFDMNGNPVLDKTLITYTPPVLHCDFKDSGIAPYPITDLKDGAITYDITEDSLVIHNQQMLSSSFCIRIDGCESGKRYRIEGNGSGIDSTKTIYGYYIRFSAYGQLAELQNDGTGKYSAEFEVPANVQAYLSLAPRYTMAETSLTNIKLVDLDDVEREVINNIYLKDIGVENLSDNLKFLLGVDGFPTSYNGDSASVFRNVLFIGDSLTEGSFNKKADPEGQNAEERAASFKRHEYSYPEFFKGISSCDGDNWGIGGETAPAWYSTITNQSSPYYKTDEQWANHDCIIINLGTNDALRGISVADTTAALNSIIDKAKSTNNGSIIFLCTTWGGVAFNGAGFDSVNEEIRSIASNRDDCILLDMNRYSHMNIDGYNNGHFTAIGYRRLAKDLHNYISYVIDTNPSRFADIQFNNTNYER